MKHLETMTSHPRRNALALVLLGALAASGLAACSSEAAPAGAPPPPQVSVASVISEPVQRWDAFSGRVSAIESVELRPRVSGYIQRVAFAEGEEVRKGDLLFVIDPRPYRAALDQAQAQLDRARSEAAHAAAQDARAASLVEAKAISREDFESRHAASSQGKAAVRAAEAAVAAARLDLEFTEVRSPIDGRAGRVLVTAGNLAQADSTMLTTRGLPGSGVRLLRSRRTRLPALRPARAPTTNAPSSRMPVQVGLASEDGFPACRHGGLRRQPGRSGHRHHPRTRARCRTRTACSRRACSRACSLAGAGTEQALLVDDKAVLTDQDRKYVYVLGEGNTAQRRDVVLGRDHRWPARDRPGPEAWRPGDRRMACRRSSCRACRLHPRQWPCVRPRRRKAWPSRPRADHH